MLATPMEASDKYYSIIRHYEQGPHGGVARYPYPDSNGKSTVGWGHLLLPNDNFTYPMSDQAAQWLLTQDTQERNDRLNQILVRQPTQDQFDAMLDLFYNIGESNFMISQVRKQFEAYQDDVAAASFANWKRDANGVIQPGLIYRRQTEKGLYLSGEVVFYN